MGRKISFPCVDIWSDLPMCKFILKNSSLECWLSFRLFLWRTQNYNIVYFFYQQSIDIKEFPDIISLFCIPCNGIYL